MVETDDDFVSTKEYCRRKGIQPIPDSEMARLSAILKNEFSRHLRIRRIMAGYWPWIALGFGVGLIAFQLMRQ